MLTCRKSEWLNDWYIIERDGQRLSDADVEGTYAEMLAIAEAIELRGRYSAYRCAVRVHADKVSFHSPRNSQGDYGYVTLAEADELAKQIREVIKATP